MSNRNWIKYTAFGGIIFAILLIGSWNLYRPYKLQHAQERQYAAQHSTGNHRPDRKLRCALLGKTELACSIQTSDSESADEYTKADLKAQQDSAEWSYLSMLLSAAALIFTVIATGGLLYSLRLTREATNAAVSAANAAVDTIKLDRAWMVFSVIDIHPTIPADAGPGHLFRARFVNSGNSPAVNCMVFSRIETFPSTDAIGEMAFSKPEGKWGTVIGPAVTAKGMPCYISENVINLLQQRKMVAVMRSRIVYNTVYDPDIERITESWKLIVPNGFHTDDSGNKSVAFDFLDVRDRPDQAT